MANFKIGVLADCFHVGTIDGMKKAAEIGAQGVQIYATTGEMAPENLTAAKRQDIVKIASDLGIEIAALCGDLGGFGFTNPNDNPSRVERSKMIMDLALDLGTKVVTTHIGVVPEDANNTRFKILQDACAPLSEHGDAVGACFAIETGPETPAVLKTFLDTLPGKGVGVNYDPANIAMVTGADVVEGVYILKDYIVHTHAKDGIMIHKTNPINVYKPWGDVDKSEANDVIVIDDELFREVPLGQGSVPFELWINALDSIGYDYYLTIEREVGDNPTADIIMAVDFLKQFLNN